MIDVEGCISVASKGLSHIEIDMSDVSVRLSVQVRTWYDS